MFKTEKVEKWEIGAGAPIEVGEKLPTPEEVFKIPKITMKSLVFVAFGPALMALGAGIGGREWITGPAVFIRFGLFLMWITLVTTTLQPFFNYECCRYAMATG